MSDTMFGLRLVPQILRAAIGGWHCVWPPAHLRSFGVTQAACARQSVCCPMRLREAWLPEVVVNMEVVVPADRHVSGLLRRPEVEFARYYDSDTPPLPASPCQCRDSLEPATVACCECQRDSGERHSLPRHDVGLRKAKSRTAYSRYPSRRVCLVYPPVSTMRPYTMMLCRLLQDRAPVGRQAEHSDRDLDRRWKE